MKKQLNHHKIKTARVSGGRVLFLALLTIGLLLLASCGESKEPTPVPDTPIPPTPTPSPTPDISASFETFSSQDGQLSFRHPPDWQILPNFDSDLFGFTSNLEALETDDLSQSFGFFIGEISWTDDFDSADPLEIHQAWLQGINPLEPAGELETIENDTMRQVSREYTAISDTDEQLLVTLVTIVNGGRVVNIMAGTTTAGQADYAAVTNAILDTVEVQYADPDTPHAPQEVIVTRAPIVTPVP